jgi:glycine/D-amino acid oxidase-like deaminating enzyme
VSDGRVIVVGGGLAGIAAALDCADAGAEVTLVEVRPRPRWGRSLGGARRMMLTTASTCSCAARGFLTPGCSPRLGSRFARSRRGAPTGPGAEAGTRRPWCSATRCPHRPTSHGRSRATAIAAALTGARGARDARAHAPDPGAGAGGSHELDREAFGEWLQRHGQSRESVRLLWDLIALPTLNLPAAEASLELAAFVFRSAR